MLAILSLLIFPDALQKWIYPLVVQQGRYALGFSSSGSLAMALATLRASSLVRYSGIIGT